MKRAVWRRSLHAYILPLACFYDVRPSKRQAFFIPWKGKALRKNRLKTIVACRSGVVTAQACKPTPLKGGRFCPQVPVDRPGLAKTKLFQTNFGNSCPVEPKGSEGAQGSSQLRAFYDRLWPIPFGKLVLIVISNMSDSPWLRGTDVHIPCSTICKHFLFCI